MICVRPVAPEENVIKRVTAVESEFVVLYPDRDHADIRRVQVRWAFHCASRLLAKYSMSCFWREGSTAVCSGTFFAF